MVYDSNNRGVIGIVLFMMLVYYYGYVWWQVYNVYSTKNYQNINYKNRMLWINTEMLDVMNPYDKKWSKHVLIDSAPNKLGIYVDKEIVNKKFVLKQLETFKILFGYNSPIIYFKHTPNNIVKDFCKKKGVEIINFSFRHTL
tara:strand:- start:7581 stop:8006 length:426 start_codon:yes stop_codon:yes gene_type:complete